jgi:hypothetical protein
MKNEKENIGLGYKKTRGIEEGEGTKEWKKKKDEVQGAVNYWNFSSVSLIGSCFLISAADGDLLLCIAV